MLPKIELHAHTPLSPEVVRDLELGLRGIRGKAPYSIVATKNGKIIAEITAASAHAACTAVGAAIDEYYRSRGWIRPWQDIVVVMNFAPTAAIIHLAGAGVDVLLALERPPSAIRRGKWVDPGPTAGLVESWLQPTYPREGEVRVNALRAIAFLAEDPLGPKRLREPLHTA